MEHLWTLQGCLVPDAQLYYPAACVVAFAYRCVPTIPFEACISGFSIPCICAASEGVFAIRQESKAARGPALSKFSDDVGRSRLILEDGCG
jgi:hypothetical protein